MLKKLVILINLIIIIALAGCSNKEHSAETVATTNDATIEQLPDNSYTLLIYMCGSTLESRYGAGSQNIEEMLNASYGENVNVLVQTGGSTSWKDKTISASSTDRYLLGNNQKELVYRDVKLQNMGAAETLYDFISYGIDSYPAEHYSLILWDHGNGSIGGVCNDSNFQNDSLSLNELENVFRDVSSRKVKFDFIGFDACLMATYDVADIISPFADYMIASEEIESISGWDYTQLISDLDKENVYENILESYKNKHCSKESYTLSVIDLSQVSQIDKTVNDLVYKANADKQLFSEAIQDGKVFGNTSNKNGSGEYYDLGILLSSMDIDYDFSQIIRCTNGKRHETATGISLFFPLNSETEIQKYNRIGRNKSYNEYLVDNYVNRPDKTIEFLDLCYEKNGHAAFLLSPDSLSYINSVYYELCSVDTVEDWYYCYGEDSDIECSDNEYEIMFEGQWVFLNDKLIHTTIIEDNDVYTAFSSPVMINGEYGSLLFDYNKKTHKIIIEGYTIIEDIESRICELEENMEISILYKKHYEDEQENYVVEDTITWNKNTNIWVKNIPKGRYQIVVKVIDVFGKTHYGSSILIEFDGNRTNIIDFGIG